MKKYKIKISDITKVCSLNVVSGASSFDNIVEGGYASDMLSDVMANSRKGDIWITIQCHPNIVAVAKLKEIAGIILANGRKPEEETIKKAEAEELPIMTTALPAFEIVGRLYEMGISGRHNSRG